MMSEHKETKEELQIQLDEINALIDGDGDILDRLNARIEEIRGKIDSTWHYVRSQPLLPPEVLNEDYNETVENDPNIQQHDKDSQEYFRCLNIDTQLERIFDMIEASDTDDAGAILQTRKEEIEKILSAEPPKKLRKPNAFSPIKIRF